MTPAQQKKAIAFLKAIVIDADKSNPDCTGFDNHEDNMELRCFLIEIGAIPDRRKAKN